jgi:hypothetical protein
LPVDFSIHCRFAYFYLLSSVKATGARSNVKSFIMNNLTVITIVIALLFALSSNDVQAQRRAENTRAAEAAYGYPAGGYKSKKKSKKKKQKQKKQKPAKKKGKQPLYRKKNPWAG